MYKLLVVILAYTLIGLVENRPKSKKNEEFRLTMALLRKYPNGRSSPRPVFYANETWHVGFNIGIQSILNVDTSAQTIELVLWKYQNWTDPNLAWDAKTERVDQLQLNPPHIIGPAIYQYNVVSEQEMLVNTYALLFPGGQVHYRYAIKQTFSCQMARTNQFTCDLKFGTWPFSEQKMNVTLSAPEMIMTNFQQNRQWEIVQTRSVRSTNEVDCCPGSYLDFTFALTLRRK